jgi:hypothetical protein
MICIMHEITDTKDLRGVKDALGVCEDCRPVLDEIAARVEANYGLGVHEREGKHEEGI